MLFMLLSNNNKLNNYIYLASTTLIASSVFSQSCRANIQFPDSLESIRPEVIEITEGLSMHTGSESQTISLTPVITNKYKQDRINNFFANWELFLAAQKNINKNILGEFGLALDTIGGLRLTGDIWQEALPIFDNFNYSYKISHYGLSIKNKFLFDIQKSFKPYLNINLGLAVNTAYDHQVTSKVTGVIAGLPFKSHSETAFMYKLGAGVQAPIGHDGYQIGIGYEFADLGKTSLGKTPIQTIQSGISLDHLYTHSVQLSLSFPT